MQGGDQKPAEVERDGESLEGALRQKMEYMRSRVGDVTGKAVRLSLCPLLLIFADVPNDPCASTQSEGDPRCVAGKYHRRLHIRLHKDNTDGPRAALASVSFC